MSKELTPLKALERLKKLEFGYVDGNGTPKTMSLFGLKEFDIIETALKRQDSIEITAIDIEQDNKELCKENKKLKRVLEIIKKKDVSMYWLRNSKSVDEYNNFILTDKRQYQKLTQEEYDLLKEVLL